MPERRVRVDKNKVRILKELRGEGKATGVFPSYAEALAFAASLGVSRGLRTPLKAKSKEIDPIRQDVFSTLHYNTLIHLLALVAEKDPQILSRTFENERITVFEEYANGGLQFLEQELKGQPDLLAGLLLVLQNHRRSLGAGEDDEITNLADIL